MTPFDYILITIAAVLLVYQMLLIFRQIKSAVIRGKAPAKTASAALLGILLALAVWRMGDLSQRWPVVVLLAAVCIAFLLGGTALGENGMFCGGRFIRYDRAAYYVIDTPDGNKPVLHLSKLTREGVMELTPEQVPQGVAFLEEKGVPTVKEYQKKVDETTERRKNAHKRKKK